jgi:bifunctional DNA-binding transcriptional regulator/antitoxin component of YhaV-PrlF toxin-antitoxin module
MSIVRVDADYRIEIPPELRSLVRVGDKVEVGTNADGSVILILPRVVDEVLDSTAGIWADRSDIPTDGVEYVDALRNGSRLTRLGTTYGR